MSRDQRAASLAGAARQLLHGRILLPKGSRLRLILHSERDPGRALIAVPDDPRGSLAARGRATRVRRSTRGPGLHEPLTGRIGIPRIIRGRPQIGRYLVPPHQRLIDYQSELAGLHMVAPRTAEKARRADRGPHSATRRHRREAQRRGTEHDRHRLASAQTPSIPCRQRPDRRIQDGAARYRGRTVAGTKLAIPTKSATPWSAGWA